MTGLPEPVAGDERELLAAVVALADETVSFAIRVVCELRLPDLLTDGPRPMAELAAATQVHPPSLARVLRALIARDVFAQPAPDVVALTQLGQLLRSDHPLSLADAYPLLGADVLAWARLHDTVRTGEPAFPAVHGAPYYDYLATHPADSARHDRSVRSQSRFVLRTVLAAYAWRELGTVVDVGGGDGTFLAGLLARHRRLRGVLLDLAHVVAGADAVLAAAGVTERCSVVAGSYFDPLPAGADSYLLKTIVHDWDDERALAVLRRVRAAVPPAGRVVLLEALLPAGDEYHVGKALDLHSLVLVGGPDRDLDQLVRLLRAAELELVDVRPTPTLAVLDARPR